MDPIEIKARREALGLNQEDMAAILGVKQITVSQWEAGLRSPRDPADVALRLANIEDVHDKIIDDLCEAAEHASAVRDAPTVEIVTYRTDAAYWEADAEARENGWPAVLHRCAAAWAKRILAAEEEIDAQIVEKS